MALGLYDTLISIKKQIKNICCRLKIVEESAANNMYVPYSEIGTRGEAGNYSVSYGTFYFHDGTEWRSISAV
jgi:hypothetical protein